jgi:hypothetical protein
MTTEFKDVSSVVDQEACWRVLERAAASPALKRAARLREFLYYVGTKSLLEGRTNIHEQEIGREVFGRGESYDTSQDNIVRVSATELRKRLDAYFNSEGRDEPIVFEIPRGSYAPAFRARAVAQPQPAPAVKMPPAPQAPAATALPLRSIPVIAVSAVALVLAAACLFLLQQNQSLKDRLHPWRAQPASTAFWSNFFNSQQQTDIVLADTSFMLIEDLTKRSYSLNDYLSPNYFSQISEARDGIDPKLLASIAMRNSGSFGDFRVAQRILTLDPGASNIVLAHARDYASDAIRRDNVILIGSRWSNPWVDLFTDQLNFAVHFDPALGQIVVTNLRPKPGEQAVYAPPADPDASLGYSVIAFLPNPSKTASALIIEGTNSEATDAAGDFVTSGDSMESFLEKLPGRKFTYFELLLRTNRVAGTPLKAEMVAFRAY